MNVTTDSGNSSAFMSLAMDVGVSGTIYPDGHTRWFYLGVYCCLVAGT